MKVDIIQINRNDELRIIVDKFSDKVIFEGKRQLNNNETLWVKIHEDGCASYGLDMKRDPLHGNLPYTWSSRAEVVNEYFHLNGTELQLAKYDVGIKEESSGYSSYLSCGYLLSKAIDLAKKNEDKLKYGINKFIEAND